MSTSAPKLHIDPYERGWMFFSLGLLITFVAAITVAGFAMGIQLPGFEQRVDPRTVDTDPNSPWSKPGLREVVPGKEYDAYILAQIWRFSVSKQPGQKELEVPVGAKVTFYITSKDVQHGFMLQNTNLNVQVVPGHVAKLTYTFEKAGRYDFICHEYCGTGHAAMFATVVVK